jgi:hypothetical protein
VRNNKRKNSIFGMVMAESYKITGQKGKHCLRTATPTKWEPKDSSGVRFNPCAIGIFYSTRAQLELIISFVMRKQKNLKNILLIFFLGFSLSCMGQHIYVAQFHDTLTGEYSKYKLIRANDKKELVKKMIAAFWKTKWKKQFNNCEVIALDLPCEPVKMDSILP